jgi:hypothetical protein
VTVRKQGPFCKQCGVPIQGNSYIETEAGVYLGENGVFAIPMSSESLYDRIEAPTPEQKDILKKPLRAELPRPFRSGINL